VQAKDATRQVLLGSGQLATELDRLELIDSTSSSSSRIAGRPTLYQGGLPSTRRLELVSASHHCGTVAMHYRRAHDPEHLIAPSSRVVGSQAGVTVSRASSHGRSSWRARPRLTSSIA
jgi:hypothetical protein